MQTIFDVQSPDRGHVRWEEHLDALTPWEFRQGVYWKREDYFAPLGYGAINGAKLRQCIWLINRNRGAQRVVTAASVKSPQLPMVTAVAKHFGIPTTIIVGATSDKSSWKHPNVAIARNLGAEVEITSVAYNPVLQRAAISRRDAEPDAYLLEYGITTTNDDVEVERFHALGGQQVSNIPQQVKTLVIPSGSCNTLTSILYGLARTPAESLQRLVLVGIGPDRSAFLRGRFESIRKVFGIDLTKLFRSDEVYPHPVFPTSNDEARYVVEYHDLHGRGIYGYQDEAPFSYAGITFHPTYEGKVMNYLSNNRWWFNRFWRGDGTVGFYIVGSRPDPKLVLKHYS